MLLACCHEHIRIKKSIPHSGADPLCMIIVYELERVTDLCVTLAQVAREKCAIYAFIIFYVLWFYNFLIIILFEKEIPFIPSAL